MYCDIAMPLEPKKTAILVRCTREEAELIRKAAAVERRTLSGFVLNAVMNRIRSRGNATPYPDPLQPRR